MTEDEKDLERMFKLTALLDGVPPPMAVREFRSLVEESKKRRLSEWAMETGQPIEHLRGLIGQPGSGLELLRLGWVRMRAVQQLSLPNHQNLLESGISQP